MMTMKLINYSASCRKIKKEVRKMKKLEMYYCEREFKAYNDEELEAYKKAINLSEAEDIMLEEKSKDIIEPLEMIEISEDLTDEELKIKAKEMLENHFMGGCKREIYHISNNLYEEHIYTVELNEYDEDGDFDTGYTVAATVNSVDNI